MKIFWQRGFHVWPKIKVGKIGLKKGAPQFVPGTIVPHTTFGLIIKLKLKHLAKERYQENWRHGFHFCNLLPLLMPRCFSRTGTKSFGDKQVFLKSWIYVWLYEVILPFNPVSVGLGGILNAHAPPPLAISAPVLQSLIFWLFFAFSVAIAT